MNNPRTNDMQPPPPGRPPAGNPMANYQISPEEMRILNECNWESFSQRSMPIGTALGVGTYMAVQRGFFKPSLRFGAFPKVTVAVITGYFIGKLSYHRRCAEKLMALPDSQIGQMLRDIRDGKSGTMKSPAMPAVSMYGAKQDDIYSDAGPGSSLDLDTDRPIFSSEDSTYSSSSGKASGSEESAVVGKQTMTYDDLRKKNREQYTEARQDPYRMDVAGEAGRTPPPSARAAPRPSRPNTNKYGDIMD